MQTEFLELLKAGQGEFPEGGRQLRYLARQMVARRVDGRLAEEMETAVCDALRRGKLREESMLRIFRGVVGNIQELTRGGRGEEGAAAAAGGSGEGGVEGGGIRGLITAWKEGRVSLQKVAKVLQDTVVVEADGTRRLSPEAEEALAEAEVRGELSAAEVTALVPDGVSIDIWES